jgi:preprotein translocase SecE subunit
MVIPTVYLQQVSRELKKVTWPSRATTIEMTMLVIAVSIIVGAYLGVLDYFFQQLMGVFI